NLETLNPDQELALLMRDPTAVNALAAKFRQLKNQATRLMTKISREDLVDFEKLLLSIAVPPGDIFLVREGINSWLSVPPSYEDFVRRRAEHRLDEESLAELVSLHSQRSQVVTAHLSRFHLRHVSSKRSITDLIT